MRRLRAVYFAVGTLACTGLSACVMGPDYEAAEQSLPESWAFELEQQAQQREQDRALWWQQFQDPVLDQLVQQALTQNLELQAQFIRIDSARAQLGLASAERFPTIGYQAEASRERLPGTALPVDNEVIQELIQSTYNTFNVSATLSYELDLWGRVARQREGAAASLRQSAYDYESARLTLIADVVTTYIEWRTVVAQYQNQLAIVADYEHALSLQLSRFEYGEAPELAVQQARTELASARAELPGLRAQRSAYESALALLVGLNPQQVFDQFADDWDHTRLADLDTTHQLPNLMPADLMQRRPDILAAEEALRAATAQVGVAEADRLPRVSIQGFFGSVATDHSDLFTSQSRAWGLTGNLSGPLIDFGRLETAAQSADLQRQQAVIQYQATVNGAYIEVRDALNLYTFQQQRYQAINEQLQSVERQLQMLEDAFELGMVSFLEVLDARRGVAQASQAQLAARGQLLSAQATLFKALGGGWQTRTG